MSRPIQISDAEYDVLTVLWEHAPISSAEVAQILAPLHDWSPKTVHTLLMRLVKKRAVSYDKAGRMFLFTPLITKKGYLQQENRSFLARFYHGRLGELISAFTEDVPLSTEDRAVLERLLESNDAPKEDAP